MLIANFQIRSLRQVSVASSVDLRFPDLLPVWFTRYILREVPDPRAREQLGLEALLAAPSQTDFIEGRHAPVRFQGGGILPQIGR